MPIYVYQAVEGGCDYCREGFELLQSMHDAPPEKCPRCGCQVEKVPANFGAAKTNLLSNTSLKEHGFTKLKKTSDGGYERTV